MANRSLLDPTLGTEVGAYVGEDLAPKTTPIANNAPVAPVVQKVAPIAPAVAGSLKKKKPIVPMVNQNQPIQPVAPAQPLVEPQAPVGDDSFIGPGPKKGLIQGLAEKKGLVKDGQVLDQTGLSNQAIARAGVAMKARAEAGEKVDEAVLQDIFDKQLKNVGIKAGTPQFAEAQRQMMAQFADQQKKLGHLTTQDAFNSINSKYNDLSKLKIKSANDIVNGFESLTSEQKNYLEQNNPNYAAAKAKIDAQNKAKQINDTINNTAGKTSSQIEEDNSQFAEGDTLKELESPEMKDLFSSISQYDDEIVTIQDEIDPKNLEKNISSRFPTSLTSGALRALADNEFNVKSEKLDKLMKLRALAKDTYETKRAEIIENDKLIRQRDNDVMSSLLDNGGLGLSATSVKDIDAMVANGQLSKAGANLIKKQQQGMTDKTIMSLGKLTPEVQQKVKSLMDQGLPVSSIMNHLVQTGQYSPTVDSSYTIEKVGDNSYARFNKATGEYEVISGASMYNDANAGANVEGVDQEGLSSALAYASTCDLTAKKQCGKGVNDIYRAVGLSAPFGNTLQSKLDARNSSMPVAGGSIIMQSPTKPENGHVMFIESVNPDGSINALERNYDGKETARRTVVQQNNPSIKGYYVPGGVKKSESSNTEGLSPLALNAYKSKSLSGTEKQRSAIISELEERGLFDEGSGNSTYYKIKPTEKEDIKKIKGGRIERDRFMGLYNSLTESQRKGFSGWLDSSAGGAIESAGGGNKKYIEMSRILGKNLSSYMKDISGATVAEQEVERLKKQIPSRGMGDKAFQEAVEGYDRAMRDTQYAIEDIYGLSGDWRESKSQSSAGGQPEVFQSSLQY